MQTFCIIVYQVVGEKSPHVVVVVFNSVIRVTTTPPIKHVNGALVVPNDLIFPSQAMQVDVVILASKLARITTITPSFKGAFVLVLVLHVYVIVNKQDSKYDSQNDIKKNENKNPTLAGTSINPWLELMVTSQIIPFQQYFFNLHLLLVP